MVTDIIDTFLAVVAGIFGGIGTGIVGMFEDIILTTTEPEPGVFVTNLSTLGLWMVAFMGLSFALTIFYAIARKVF